MLQLERQPVRLKVDTSLPVQIKDEKKEEAPSIWRGDDVAFEVGLFRGAELLDVSNFASLTLDIKANDYAGITGAPLLSRTVSGAEITNTVTAETWADESAQHAQFIFTGEETNLDLGGAMERVFYLLLYGLTSDVPVRRITLGYAWLTVKEGGAYGLLPLSAAHNGSYRVKNSNQLQIYDRTLEQWRTLYIENGQLWYDNAED